MEQQLPRSLRIMRLAVACALLLTAIAPVAGQEDRIRLAAQRLSSLTAKPNPTAENQFVLQQASALLDKWRRVPPDAFIAGRLELAVQDLLDASERLTEAHMSPDRNDASEETRRLMARDLERTYFRLQEGDYFSRQATESNAAQYVVAARRVYQLARVAYDEKSYARVRTLSQASRDIISSLERLAQAARGVPDPPRLPEI